MRLSRNDTDWMQKDLLIIEVIMFNTEMKIDKKLFIEAYITSY